MSIFSFFGGKRIGPGDDDNNKKAEEEPADKIFGGGDSNLGDDLTMAGEGHDAIEDEVK